MPTAIEASAGHGQPEPRCGEDEEPPRDLGQQAGAVGRTVRGRGAAVGESRRRFERQLHHFMRAFAALARDEPDAAGVPRRIGGAGVLVVDRAASGVRRGHVGWVKGCR